MSFRRDRNQEVVGLFAGIGGIEVGLHRSGFATMLLCENAPAAQEVLRAQFSDVPLAGDVRTLKSIPKVALVAAGFPCQDLSQAGRTAGIGGRQSSLVDEVFRLVEESEPEWLLLENVPFMLQLDRGRAMHFLTTTLEDQGLRWAYRVVDSRSFGLPHRRKRVVLLASRKHDPRPPLLTEEAGEPVDPDYIGRANGFYWTEGIRGLGWAIDAVPTLKGGSTIGIPSPPAIWMPDSSIVTPDIRDAERLQGFEPDWTISVAEAGGRKGDRWKLVGNAVSVPVAEWVGSRLSTDDPYEPTNEFDWDGSTAWPSAAWGEPGAATVGLRISHWPVCAARPSLADFLRFAPAPLSVRASRGFLHRTSRSSLRFPPGLLDAVQDHLERRGGEQRVLVAT